MEEGVGGATGYGEEEARASVERSQDDEGQPQWPYITGEVLWASMTDLHVPQGSTDWGRNTWRSFYTCVTGHTLVSNPVITGTWGGRRLGT